jgi:hypothetical protein
LLATQYRTAALCTLQRSTTRRYKFLDKSRDRDICAQNAANMLLPSSRTPFDRQRAAAAAQGHGRHPSSNRRRDSAPAKLAQPARQSDRPRVAPGAGVGLARSLSSSPCPIRASAGSCVIERAAARPLISLCRR